MGTNSTGKHKLQDAQTELFVGQLVYPHEHIVDEEYLFLDEKSIDHDGILSN